MREWICSEDTHILHTTKRSHIIGNLVLIFRVLHLQQNLISHIESKIKRNVTFCYLRYVPSNQY